MAIKQLTEEQVRDWTLEQKDRWWLENVYRGNMPQLTIRSALTGFLLGGILSSTNLYIGAKTGWSMGVGITSVILAFAMFKVMSRLGLAQEFTILENNAMQSIATAAGYMTAPLISSLAAYMIADDRLLPWHQIIVWNVVVSLLGVLFAFPMKRRFINDEQHPFPEGRAAGVVMDTLHSADAAIGMAKARALVQAAGAAALLQFLMADAIQKAIQHKLLGLKERLHDAVIHIPHKIDGLLEWVGIQLKIGGTDIRQLSLTAVPELPLIGAGGLMGIRAGVSLMIGALLNFAVLAPWMIAWDEIRPVGGNYGFRQITVWSLWPGVACMVIASLVAFFAKPKMLLDSFRGLLGRKSESSDVLRDIEFPLWISLVGIPVLSLVAAVLAHLYFDVNILVCLLGIPLTFLLSFVAANSTAQTGTTPVGATSKITQLFYGAVQPGNIKTNLATAGLTAEVVSNSSNLLMDIKPGYMLGAKPRQQAIGHVIGIIAGSLASVPLFYLLFTSKVAEEGVASIQDDRFPMPSATIWKAVADMLALGLSNLPRSVAYAALAGGLIGLALEVGRIVTRGRFPLSPIALGLAFVIPFNSSVGMFLGALFFWLMGVGREHAAPPEAAEEAPADAAEAPPPDAADGSRENLAAEKPAPDRPAPPKPGFWVENHEPICAGIIAGASLVGIVDAALAALLP
jgi:uncharacterized oligopeptide transporter (OPT) family protein